MIFSAEREVGPPAAGARPANPTSSGAAGPGCRGPDLQPIHFSAPLYEEGMEGPANGFTLMAGMIRPDQPRVHPPQRARSVRRATQDRPDLSSVGGRSRPPPQQAAELCRRVGAAQSAAGVGRARSCSTPAPQSGPRVRTCAAYLRSTVLTYHHQAGSCKMGIDDAAVVDPPLRVYGIDGLRVADASIMPTVTTGNTNAPSIMIGERAAEFLLADA